MFIQLYLDRFHIQVKTYTCLFHSQIFSPMGKEIERDGGRTEDWVIRRKKRRTEYTNLLNKCFGVLDEMWHQFQNKHQIFELDIVWSTGYYAYNVKHRKYYKCFQIY